MTLQKVLARIGSHRGRPCTREYAINVPHPPSEKQLGVSPGRLQRQLETFFESRGLGEVFNAPLDTILGPHDIVEPVLLDPATISRRAIQGPPAYG